MASLLTCAPASHSIGALRRSSAGVHVPSLVFITPARHSLHAHPNLRLKKEVSVLVKKNRSWSPVFASNINPSDDSKMSDGPPMLTILAGVLVFFFICWLIGSIVMWLVGLIVHPPPLK